MPPKRPATAPPQELRNAKRADHYSVSSVEGLHGRITDMGVVPVMTCMICMDPLADKTCDAYRYNCSENYVCGECHAQCQHRGQAIMHGEMRLTPISQSEIAVRESSEALNTICVRCCCGTLFPLHYGSKNAARRHFDACPDALANEVLRASDAGEDPADPLRRARGMSTPICRRPRPRRPDAFRAIAEGDPERLNIAEAGDGIVPHQD
jgi:hypothetical protein